jgi:hypothetical protein
VTSNLLILAVLVFTFQTRASTLFEDDTVLEVNLVGPLSSLVDKKERRAEMPFILRANDVEHSIKLRVRGNSRIKLCNFPPLRIRFSADDTAESVFASQNKLKLVTHCRLRDSNQTNTLEEYAAYRIFNLVSDVGYKVRLLHITYTDTDEHSRDNSFERYGFLIESESELADRVGGQPAHVDGVTLASLDKRQAATVFIFQYLIANTDWSLAAGPGKDTCCHNGDLVDIGSYRYYVPYDFDLSGLVNTRYARKSPLLRSAKVRQRRYGGHCISAEALRGALVAINARRVDILGVIRQVPGLFQKDIEETVEYLDKFFVQAEDDDKLLQTFEDRCIS